MENDILCLVHFVNLLLQRMRMEGNILPDLPEWTTPYHVSDYNVADGEPQLEGVSVSLRKACTHQRQSLIPLGQIAVMQQGVSCSVQSKLHHLRLETTKPIPALPPGCYPSSSDPAEEGLSTLLFYVQHPSGSLLTSLGSFYQQLGQLPLSLQDSIG